MEKEVVKRLIVQGQEKEVDMVRRSSELDFVGKINVVIGPRRAGKTYFIYQTMNDLKLKGFANRILYINFEDERLWPIEKEDLDEIFEAYYELYPENKDEKLYVFFDEIQEVPLWQKFVRRVHENNNIELCLTGSSSKLLSKEIATELRGRTLTYRILPFSFREFLAANGVELARNIEYSKQRFIIKKLFNEYLKFGGFPEIVDKKDDVKIRVLQEYFDVLFYKDLVERFKIRNEWVVKDLMHHITTNFGRLFSANAYYNLLTSKNLKISKNTVLEYLGYLEEIFYVFLVPRFSFSLKEQSVSPKKAYVSDNGFANAVAFQFSKNTGHFYENLVLVQLKRTDAKIYYWKKDNECDFIVKEKNKVVEAIQVCSDLHEKNKEREMAGLVEAMGALNLKKGTLITKEEEKEIRVKGKKITLIPLWKWLLSKEPKR